MPRTTEPHGGGGGGGWGVVTASNRRRTGRGGGAERERDKAGAFGGEGSGQAWVEAGGPCVPPAHGARGGPRGGGRWGGGGRCTATGHGPSGGARPAPWARHTTAEAVLNNGGRLVAVGGPSGLFLAKQSLLQGSPAGAGPPTPPHLMFYTTPVCRRALWGGEGG